MDSCWLVWQWVTYAKADSIINSCRSLRLSMPILWRLLSCDAHGRCHALLYMATSLLSHPHMFYGDVALVKAAGCLYTPVVAGDSQLINSRQVINRSFRHDRESPVTVLITPDALMCGRPMPDQV